MSATMTMKETMKAVAIHSFGGPDVLSFEEMPKPEPRQNEVLIRIRAAGVNPVDWKIREGYMGEVQLPSIMGSDFSGVIESVGPGVKNFQAGEAVFGIVSEDSGSYAEFALAPEARTTRKPHAIDHVQAAALPIASLTAWQALFEVANLQEGQKVLIHGAAGGVGGFAVQFSRWKGAHVIGTASAHNAEFVRQLGADVVIDYRATPFEQAVNEIDVVFDTIGGETQERSWKVLKRGGILVSIVQPPSQQKAAEHGARGSFLVSKPKGEQLAQIAELVEREQIKVYIEAVLPLREARKAQEMSQSGHTRGKMVLVVD
jgi:NADPH:quinone reductase-like Zn-dependent oxidoreductase